MIGYWSRIRLKLQVSSRTEAVSIIKSLALKASEETGQALQHELQEKSEEAVVLRNQSLELEKKVRERTAALHEANKVLEEEVLRRTQSEEALKQSEFKFRSLYENAEVALFTSNVDGSALSEANLLALSLFQGTRSQLIGKPTINFWADPEQRSVVVQRLMAEGKIAGVECDFLGRKGSVKHCSVNAVLDRETSLIEWSAIDITDKARAKRIIDKNLDRTRLLLNLHERSPKLNDQDLYHLILDIAVELTDSSVGFFHLVSGDQENIQLTAWNKETLKACTALYDTHYSINQAGNWVDCIRDKKPVFYNDYMISPNQKGLPKGHLPIDRFMSVPVISDGKVRIIFGVGNKHLPYDENDARQIELLAFDVQPILENRQLHQDLVRSESEVRRKLDALVNPDEDLSELDLVDLLDLQEFDKLFKLFRDMTGIAGGFIGVDGQGYAGNNWQEVCAKYHRANLQSCKQCVESDRLLTADIKAGSYKLYKCFNNLWELATPLFYGERKLGYVVFGQFFFEDEKPNMEEFARQAETYGFDKASYFESLAKVPVFSREYVHSALALFSSICNVLLGLNFSKLKIARHLNERIEMFEMARMGEQRYRSVVESVSDWIYGTNTDGVLTYVSSKVESSLGYAAVDLVGKTVSYLVCPSSPKQARDEFNDIWFSCEPIEEHPVSLMHRNGTTREYVCNGKPIYDSMGRFAGSIGSMRDVTERKKAEEALKRSEEKFRTAFQTSPDAVNINRLSDGLYLESNDGFAEILGYFPEEVQGKTSLELDIWDDPADRKRLVEGLLCDGEVDNLEARFRHRDGTIRYGLMSACIIELEGEPCILSITRDITERKEVEKKLARNQAELKAVYDNAPVMICVLDEDRRVLYANPAFTSYTGVSEDELRTGRACGVFGCINASEDPRGCGYGGQCTFCSLLLALDDTVETGVGHRQIERTLTIERDGTRREVTLLGSTAPIRFDERKNILLCLVDISERKQAETELRFLSSSVEQVTESVTITNARYEITYINQAAQDLYGYTLQELEGKTPAMFNTEPMAEDIQNDIYATISSGRTYFGSARNRRKDGSTFICELKISPLYDKDGVCTHYIGIQRDITERKQAEEELKDSRAYLESALDMAQMANWEYNVESGLFTFNDRFYALYGTTAEREGGYQIPAEVYAREFVHPDDAFHVGSELNKVASTHDPDFKREIEHRIIRRDGETRNIVVRYGVKLDDSGNVVMTYGANQDITDHKRAEEKLRASDERFLHIDSSSRDAIYSYDQQGRFTHASQSLCVLLGLTREQIVGKTHAELGFPQAQCDEWSALHRKVYETNQSVISETISPIQGGPMMYFEVVLNPIHDEAGEIIGISGTTRDITERKRAEEALRANEEKLRETARIAKVGGWEIDFEGDTLAWTDETFRIHELDPGQPPCVAEAIRFYHIDDQPRVAAAVQKAVETLVGFDFEARLVTAQNNLKWVRAIGAAVTREGHTVGIQGMIQDITDRKQAEAQLNLQSLVLNQIQDRVTVTDTNGVITYVNDAETRAIGYSREQLIGASTDLYGDDPERGATQREILEKTLRFGEWRGEVVNFTASGNETILDCRTQTVRDEHGVVIALAGFATDITEQKRTEKALRDSEEMHRALVEGLPDIVMRFDRDGRHLFVSDNVRDTIDIEPDYFLGKTHSELGFPKELCQFLEESIRQVFVRGKPIETEFTVEGKSGPVTFDWRLLPERDGNDVVSSVLSVSRDITAYRKVEQEYQTLFHQMLDGFALHEIILDSAGTPVDYRFLAVNPAFERLTGLKATDIVGRTVLEVLSDTEQHWIEKYGQVALTGVPIHFESYSEALHRHFEVAAFRPAPMQFACLFADITDRKQATARILAAQQELEEKVAQRTGQLAEANAELEAFSYSVSHDLRAPLRTLGGFAQILKEDYRSSLDDDGVYLIDRIGASAEHMGHLIDGLLRLSRISRSRLEIKKVCLSDICNTFIELIESSEKGSTIEWAIEPGVWADCDEQLVESLIDNLLSNAVKYSSKTDRPKVCFGTMQVGSDVVYYIKDNGIGFDMSSADRLFNAFQRLHSRDEYEGLGIGLATARRIVSRHAGRIWAESKPGEGSKFFFTLPNRS